MYRSITVLRKNPTKLFVANADLRHRSTFYVRICLLGNFACFLSSNDFFPNQLFKQILSGNTIRVSNSLDPDQARQFVGPDLGPNSLQMLSADDTSR